MHNIQSNKIFGTTIYIGSVPLDTKFGTFTCHTYQNLIHKGYILALAYGDLKAPELFTRVHSSCVTSETLCSLDCDCVLQLEGAMEKISQKGNGILFYMIQEGRGCGYVGKARACMMVQYYDDKISTFDAYKALGMKADYRDYRNIWEVTHMLGINESNFVLLTNNPDKINGLIQSGLNIKRVESIEITPSSFNQSYLVSKEKTGHLLYQTKTKVPRYKIPYKRIAPFEPYSLPHCSRFIHCASYYLPIHATDRDTYPNWFKVNMYYDVVSQSDYIVLTYGDLENKIPMVRIHSESLFNRFPLREKPYSEKYKNSLKEIIKNESGVIILLYHDGRGAGLGSYVLAQTNDAMKTGTPIDSRDYDAVAMLLEHHIPQKKLNVLYSSSSRVQLKEALSKQGLEVQQWIQLNQKDESKGHELIARRIHDAPHYLLDLHPQHLKLDNKHNYIITGIGTSEAHARYFMYCAQKFNPELKINFLPLTAFPIEQQPKTTLIVISQGLSPNVHGALHNWDYKNIILLTSVTKDNKDQQKTQILKKLYNHNSTVYTFPLEDEYTTLIRTIGPLAGYYFILKLLHPNPSLSLSSEKLIFNTLKQTEQKVPSNSFYETLKENQSVVLLHGYPLNTFSKNLANKLEEGAFISSVRLVDYLEFSHGVFQNIEHQFECRKQNNIIMINDSKQDAEYIDRIKLMLSDKYPYWIINSSLAEDLRILEYEMIFNHFILRWMELMNIDQIQWAGKDKQNHMYDWQFNN